MAIARTLNTNTLPAYSGWQRPACDRQPSLFPLPVGEVLAILGVSSGEARRWHEAGWVSFAVDQVTELHDPEQWELAFVRDLARSPLTVAQINELLATLPKPFCYDPECTAYHFRYGWVVPSPVEPRELLETELAHWLAQMGKAGELTQLQAILELVQEAMAQAKREE